MTPIEIKTTEYASWKMPTDWKAFWSWRRKPRQIFTRGIPFIVIGDDLAKKIFEVK